MSKTQKIVKHITNVAYDNNIDIYKFINNLLK